MSVLFYRRPDYLNKENGPINAEACQRYVERAKSKNQMPSTTSGDADYGKIGSERSIPNGLAFEDVINGKSLPVRIALCILKPR